MGAVQVQLTRQTLQIVPPSQAHPETFLPEAGLATPSPPLSLSPKLFPALVPPKVTVAGAHHTDPGGTGTPLPQEQPRSPCTNVTAAGTQGSCCGHIGGTRTKHCSWYLTALQHWVSLNPSTQRTPKLPRVAPHPRIMLCLLRTDPHVQDSF